MVKFKMFVVLLVLFSLVMCVSVFAVTEVTGCFSVGSDTMGEITEDVELNYDITCEEGTGVVLSGEDITLNCNGKKIS